LYTSRGKNWNNFFCTLGVETGLSFVYWLGEETGSNFVHFLGVGTEPSYKFLGVEID
jgi:hypothetical protein